MSSTLRRQRGHASETFSKAPSREELLALAEQRWITEAVEKIHSAKSTFEKAGAACNEEMREFVKPAQRKLETDLYWNWE